MQGLMNYKLLARPQQFSQCLADKLSKPDGKEGRSDDGHPQDRVRQMVGSGRPDGDGGQGGDMGRGGRR